MTEKRTATTAEVVAGINAMVTALESANKTLMMEAGDALVDAREVFEDIQHSPEFLAPAVIWDSAMDDFNHLLDQLKEKVSYLKAVEQTIDPEAFSKKDPFDFFNI